LLESGRRVANGRVGAAAGLSDGEGKKGARRDSNRRPSPPELSCFPSVPRECHKC
jgi:hypothetical protein